MAAVRMLTLRYKNDQKSMDDVTVRIILYTQFLRFFFAFTNMSAGYVVVSFNRHFLDIDICDRAIDASFRQANFM